MTPRIAHEHTFVDHAILPIPVPKPAFKMSVRFLDTSDGHVHRAPRAIRPLVALRRPGPARCTHGPIWAWELTLIDEVASRFRTTERDDLEAELARKLLVLKSRFMVAQARDWNAYVTKFLCNKAANWVRDWRARENRKVNLRASPEEIFHDEKSHPSGPTPVWKSEHDLSIAFTAAWNELDPESRGMWEMLLEENGNQVRVARRLGKHRNTVHHWVLKIRLVLERHGFGAVVRRRSTGRVKRHRRRP